MLRIAPLLFLAACASAPRAPASSTDAVAVRPAPIDPQLPRTERLSHRIRSEIGPTAMAELLVCSRPSGKVSSVALVSGGEKPSAFEFALVEDVAQWSYESTPGPDSIERCQRQSVRFRPHP